MDQENIIGKRKTKALKITRQGGTVRGTLVDLNTNVQAQPGLNNGKLTGSAAATEKTGSHRFRNRYSHVKSKIDTGLATKPTTSLACKKSASRTKPDELKDSPNINIQNKKSSHGAKKTSTRPVVQKETKTLKPISKDPTEPFGKLKLSEASIKKKQERVELQEPEPIIPVLRDDIKDTDAGDNDPSLEIYIEDIYKYLTELEEKYPIAYDHMSRQTEISNRRRASLINWMVEIQVYLSMLSETLHLAVGIIDRYLQAVPSVPRNNVQVIGITAMFIARKYEESYAARVDDFLHFIGNLYSKEDIYFTEAEILSKLEFSLARPIPVNFLDRFVKAAHGTSANRHLAEYFVDLSLVEYTMSHYRPSELASAAICLSLHLLSNKTLAEMWSPTLAYCSGYTLEHIHPIIRNLAKIVVAVEKSSFKAVYRKYLHKTLGRVSSLPQLQSVAINELAEMPSST